jgi:hypothetical protein
MGPVASQNQLPVFFTREVERKMFLVLLLTYVVAIVGLVGIALTNNYGKTHSTA